MTPPEASALLQALADPQTATEAAAFHKAPRTYLGVSVPQIDSLVARWRADLTVEARITLAAHLWDTNIHDARLAAAKLLTQARLRPDTAAWALICTWAATLDAWALADHAMIAGQKRLLADPSRIETVADWTRHPNMWTRRAALVITLPWTKQNHPTPQHEAVRDRVLGWCATYADDPDWFIQKTIARWLRDLAKHDPARAERFLATHGHRLKPFALKEARQYLP